MIALQSPTPARNFSFVPTAAQTGRSEVKVHG
jgi:hypothetical protein